MADSTTVAALLERVDPLLHASGAVLVVERAARGAGQVRWFWCRSLSDVESTLALLRPGSQVGFFFDGGATHREFSDDVEAEIWDQLSEHGELFVGTVSSSAPELDLRLLDLADASEDLARLARGEHVFFGPFPAIQDDGDRVIKFVPPDPDGIVRPQPT